MSFLTSTLEKIKQASAHQTGKLQKNREQKAKTLLEHKKTEAKTRKKYQEALERNPYLQSKALWNDMYGSVQTKLENSYRIIMLLSAVIVVAIIGFVIVSSQTKVKPMPFIVHGNDILTVDQSQSGDFKRLKPKLAYYFAKHFIRDARSVSVDGDVNANNRISALSFVTGASVPVLNDFYQKNDPNRIANTYVKNIHITNVLRLSANTLDVRWQEIWRNVRSGELMRTKNYLAQLTYHYNTPSENTLILRNNPLGFDITNLSWSVDNDN